LHVRKARDARLVRAMVILVRNTTWRCGKLEKMVVRSLYRMHADLGKPGMPLKEVIRTFKVTGKQKNELLDAIKRLERRNIVKILVL